jgi:hypothetical protein
MRANLRWPRAGHARELGRKEVRTLVLNLVNGKLSSYSRIEGSYG